MSKFFNIFIVALLLVSVSIQGQMVYTCHSEGSVHLMSSCCDDMQVQESCCESETETEGKQLKEKCCSEVEVKFLNNFNSFEDYKLKSNSDSEEAFYLPFTNQLEVIEDKSLSVNTRFNNSPPRIQRQLYVKICSFLC